MHRIPTLENDSTWVGRTMEERASGIESACRAAMQVLHDSDDRAERLNRTDDIPQSTRDLLRRLAAVQ